MYIRRYISKLHMNQLIGSLITTCKQISLDLSDDIESSIKALIILSMRSIDHKDMLEKTLPNVYVDWQMVSHIFGDNLKNPLVRPSPRNIIIWRIS
jgi:hypothetical protein